MRERGLKSRGAGSYQLLTPGRSREGAWIEIIGGAFGKLLDKGRSREGAWIEI